jgi:RimJ/RimL family protein N-acetyltransferase
MLHGREITLRPVRAADLDELYRHHVEIANRGDFFPINVYSESSFNKQFQESGFWDRDEGMLVIVDATDRIVGHIEFFWAVPTGTPTSSRTSCTTPALPGAATRRRRSNSSSTISSTRNRATGSTS